MEPRTGPLPLSWWTRVVISVAGLVGALSRATGRGRGGTLPGRVVLRLRPQVLRELASGRTVALVSGTNGKSTTTRLLSAALAPSGPVATNGDGSNLAQGLVGALMGAGRQAGTAVLEVDEMALPAALSATRADVVVLLNLSRDQLDRVEEVASHVSRWSTALREAPRVTVVANADDPLVVAAVLGGEVDDDRRVWVAAGAPWRGDAASCPRCGFAWDQAAARWRCAACGLAQPAASWALVGDRLVGPDGLDLPLDLALPGRASAADAVLAAAAADLLGVPGTASVPLMRDVQDVDGRYLTVTTGARTTRLLLAKNPAGWLEVIDQLSSGDEALLLGVNARTADGLDPSWLWDVPFERLRGRRVVAFGERALDLAVRLDYAGVAHEITGDVDRALQAVPDDRVVVAANYTAFVHARTVLRTLAA